MYYPACYISNNSMYYMLPNPNACYVRKNCDLDNSCRSIYMSYHAIYVYTH